MMKAFPLYGLPVKPVRSKMVKNPIFRLHQLKPEVWRPDRPPVEVDNLRVRRQLSHKSRHVLLIFAIVF